MQAPTMVALLIVKASRVTKNTMLSTADRWS